MWSSGVVAWVGNGALQAMGPMSYNEKLVCAVMGGALVLWVGGESLGIAPAVTAMLGLR